MKAAYTSATKVFSRLHNLQHAVSILGWDAMVNMPPGGAEARGQANAEIEVIMHDTLTQATVGALLDSLPAPGAAAADDFSPMELANVREMRRNYLAATKLSADLVERKALITSEAEQAWRRLRAANDWEAFKPYLTKVLSVTKEVGVALSAGTDMTPYEALIDQYEPGIRQATLDRIFADLKGWVPAAIKKAVEDQKALPAIIKPQGPFPIEKQKELGMIVMRDLLKFDFNHGRLDVSAHPFCGGVPSDVRLTTRYVETDFEQSLMGVIHETGHSKYEQNRPKEFISQPVSAARSMGIHESQSLFQEMQIGRSTAFTTKLSEILGTVFGPQPAFDGANLARMYHRVQPAKIRVDADELCYPMHVCLRYEIETQLLAGTLAVDDLPQVWNAKMKEYLGVDTDGDFKNGCMQDIHWSLGLVGYFPTYSLGAMYAAQLMAACRRKLGDEALDEMIRTGRMEPVHDWLRENVWSKGSFYATGEELVAAATGETLNVAFYKEHLLSRYTRATA